MYVINALRKGGCNVDSMEDWTAATDEPKRFSVSRVRDCDLCVLLVALRRGHVPDGEELSVTQLEYEAATEYGYDVLVFMLDEHAAWPRQFDEFDKDSRLRQWRAHLKEKKTVGFFDNKPNSIEILAAFSRWQGIKIEEYRNINIDAADKELSHLVELAIKSQVTSAHDIYRIVAEALASHRGSLKKPARLR